MTLNNLGMAYADLRKLEQAIDCFQGALAIRREAGDRYGEGITLTNLGGAYQKMRQPDRAAACWRDAAAAMRATGDHEEAGVLEQLAADTQAQRHRWWWRGSRPAGN